jgi:diguanylate cyclase (GGDEF)-like protein
MKLFPYRIHSIEELDGCLAAFRKVCPQRYSSILVTVFTAHVNLEIARTIEQCIAAQVPDAVIVGQSTSGEVVNGELSLHSTVISFQVFESSFVRALVYDCTDLPVKEAGRQAAEVCLGIEHIAGFCIIGTLKGMDVKPFLRELSQVNPAIPVFGGGADSYTASEQGFVFAGTTFLKKGIIAVVFFGSELNIHISTNFGWRPMGQAMTITAMDGPLVIKELDFKPAISVYEKYLNIKQDESFYQDIIEFPIFVERNGKQMARLPVDFRDDGSLVFAADFRLGERVRLSYGDPTEILVSSHINQHDIAAFQPQGILIFTCITRRVFLGDDVKLEIAPYMDIAPTAGAYTYGEITSFHGEAEAMNILFLAVGFREGPTDKTSCATLKDACDATAFKDTMSLVQRLVRFINVTTTELEEANRKQEIANHKLEEANRKLMKLARQDRLTELLNRGEIASVLVHEAEHLREEDLPFSAIMIDLDDFKAVNDTYGHTMGDEVLRSVARVLLHSIRGGDYAGRWGGEEFLILLPGSTLHTAEIVAERIRVKVFELSVLPDGNRITGSFGVAQMQPEERAEAFYQRIDNILYHAKRDGKNRVATKE